jgi:hypothetical protein
MHRTDAPGNAANLFVDGNPVTGTQATLVDDDWLNAVQEELCGLIESAGITLVKGTNTQLLQAFQTLLASRPDVRQTVLSGVASSGVAAVLGTSVNLNAAIAATATPLVIAFAAGFGANGAIDYIKRLAADTTVTLPASQTSYVYADRDPTTGALTFGSSLLVPAYGYTHPGGPATDQHSFLIHEMQMYRWSGAAWVAVQRVFMGQAVTSGSAVTSVINYAFKGKALVRQAPTIAVSTQYQLSHNIGVATFLRVSAFLENVTTDAGYVTGDRYIPATGNDNNSTTTGAGMSTDRLLFNYATAGTLPALRNKTTGANAAMTGANWAVGAFIERAW